MRGGKASGADNVRDTIRTIIFCAVILGAIVFGFKFSKGRAEALIEPADHSMDPAYPPGNHRMDTSLYAVSQLRVSDVIAYWLSDNPGNYRVARVVALEGDRIKIEQGVLVVNGANTPHKVGALHLQTPEFRIPRGCVFVAADDLVYAFDSMKIGPVPFCQVYGRLR